MTTVKTYLAGFPAPVKASQRNLTYSMIIVILLFDLLKLWNQNVHYFGPEVNSLN